MSNILHVYSSEYQHQNAFIVGDIDSLYSLKKAVDDALGLGKGKFETFTSDGEGYTLHVVKVPIETAEQLSFPYTDKTMSPAIKFEGAIDPWTLI